MNRELKSRSEHHHRFPDQVGDIFNAEEIKNEYTPSEEASFENLKQFIFEAALRGTHFQVPQPKPQTDAQWANNWIILGLYLYTGLSLKNIATMYKKSKQRMSEIIENASLRMLEHADNDLKEKYKKENFSYSKPIYLQSFYISQSKSKQDKLTQVAELVKEGKSAQEISEFTGLSFSQITDLRQVLSKEGIKVPLHHRLYEVKKDFPKLTGEEDASDEEVQGVLDNLTTTLAGNNLGVTTSFTELAGEIGLKMNGRRGSIEELERILKESGVPARTIIRVYKERVMRYGVIAIKHRAKALEVLRQYSIDNRFQKIIFKQQDSLDSLSSEQE